MKNIFSMVTMTIAAVMIISCQNNNPKASLKNDVDTLSYAIGVAQTKGLTEYLMNNLDVDTTYMDEFVKGISESVNAGEDKKKKAYYAGIQIGEGICKMAKSINQDLYGDGSKQTISIHNMMAGFVNTLSKNGQKMTVQEAETIANTLYDHIKNHTMKENSQPAINTNWQYSVREDKLNGTKNYSAAILSIDGRIQFHMSDIDGWGNGNYTTVFSFGWFDDVIPPLSRRSMIGLKFPGDTEWRKIPVSGKGDRVASFDIMYPKELVGLLTTSKKFTLLYTNEEFEFRPNAPLDWSHGEKAIPNQEEVEEVMADTIATEYYD